MAHTAVATRHLLLTAACNLNQHPAYMLCPPVQVLDLEGRLQQSTAEHADFKEAAGANLAVIQEQLQRLKGQAGPADTSADQGEQLRWHKY